MVHLLVEPEKKTVKSKALLIATGKTVNL